jgi:hypothetical protein
MSPAERQQALALYDLVRQETSPARLESFAVQDLIRLQATTGLPWSVCARLCQVARCRFWAQRYAHAKQLQKMRRERKLLASHARYFTALQRDQDTLTQPLTFLATRGT